MPQLDNGIKQEDGGLFFSIILLCLMFQVFLANKFLIFISRSLKKSAKYISGEYVCVEDNGKALFSYIPPEDSANDNQLIGSNLEQMIVINKATNIKFQGLKFQHTSQGGKDGYRWGTEAAIRIFNR